MNHINSAYYVDFVKTLAKSGSDINKSLSDEKCHLIHMAIGLSGEVSELIEGIIFDPTNLELIIEELGDIEFYFQGLMDGSDISISEDDLKHCPDFHSISEYAVRLVICSGNILDYVKKHTIYEQKIPAEFHDLLIYFQRLLTKIRRILNISRVMAIQHNISKLNKRYSGIKYSNEAAKERADKNE